MISPSLLRTNYDLFRCRVEKNAGRNLMPIVDDGGWKIGAVTRNYRLTQVLVLYIYGKKENIWYYTLRVSKTRTCSLLIARSHPVVLWFQQLTPRRSHELVIARHN